MSVGVAACGNSSTLEIESTTAWTGSVTNNKTNEITPIKGTGNASLDMNTDDFCWIIQKDTENGLLHVYAKIDRFMATDIGGNKTTFDPFGVASSCSGY
jgi:hypothetical protein